MRRGEGRKRSTELFPLLRFPENTFTSGFCPSREMSDVSPIDLARHGRRVVIGVGASLSLECIQNLSCTKKAKKLGDAYKNRLNHSLFSHSFIFSQLILFSFSFFLLPF